MTQTENYAPVALFVYNRPAHTRKTIEALKANELAALTRLHIFCDAPHNAEAEAEAREVREYVSSVNGFAAVDVVLREKNMGLAASIIDGVTALCDRFGKVIVLEDDLITSPYFLRYMNDALTIYEHREEVASISAYMYPVAVPDDMPDTVLLRYPSSWGWATWARAWRLFDADGNHLQRQLEAAGLSAEFDRVGLGSFLKMLRAQIRGKNNSWFIRWHASLFLHGKYSLAPSRSLINNIGLDGSGVHCSTWVIDPFQAKPSMRPVTVTAVGHEVDQRFIKSMQWFFLRSRVLRYVNALYRVLGIAKLLRVGRE